MTSNIATIYNTLANDPNAMAALSMVPAETRTNFLVTMGTRLGLPVSRSEAREFFLP